MSSEVNLPSAGSLCEFRVVSTSTAFVSSAYMAKYFKACESRPLRRGGLLPETFTTRKSIVCNLPFLSHARVISPSVSADSAFRLGDLHIRE